MRCTLVTAAGAARRVGPAGLVIGRQSDCDLVVTDPAVSRRHALVRLTSDGAEVVPLGRTPIVIGAASFSAPRALSDADQLHIGSMTLTVQLTARRPEDEPGAAFCLVREGGEQYGLTHTPFVLGGAPTDDLIFKRWPPHALAIHLAQGELFLEVAEGTARRNDDELPAGTLEPLEPDDAIGFRRERFTVRRSSSVAATTAIGPGGAHWSAPNRVEIELLPRGGRFALHYPSARYAVFLHDRRIDLLMSLVRPPQGYRAGEFVPDDVICSIVWPRKPASRTELNILISRCRKDLLNAGIAAPRLIERAPGGGGTRIVLAPDAEVIVT